MEVEYVCNGLLLSQNAENPEILTEIAILVQIPKFLSVYIFRVLHMVMKSMQVGFRSKNVQYTTGASPSAQEKSGVACARPHPPSRTSGFSRFSRTGQSGGSLRWSEGLAGKLRLGAR